MVAALTLLGVAFLVQHRASADVTPWSPPPGVADSKCFNGYSKCIECIVNTDCGFFGDAHSVLYGSICCRASPLLTAPCPRLKHALFLAASWRPAACLALLQFFNNKTVTYFRTTLLAL